MNMGLAILIGMILICVFLIERERKWTNKD